MTDVTSGATGAQPARKTSQADATQTAETKPFAGVASASTSDSVIGATPSSGSTTESGSSGSAGGAESGVLVQGVELAQAKADEAREWAQRQKDVLAARVRENPVGSSAVVFGAGVILGLLLARR
jgi:cobalamin biosynthesis Mg chelatase CobN